MTANPSSYVLYTDGGSRGNPGPAAAGVVLTDSSGRSVYAAGLFLGRMTNNQAEYRALLAGLAEAVRRRADRLIVRSDSELVVRQINGEYRVKNPDLKPLYEQAINLLAKIADVRVEHIRREMNVRADRLANRAMDARANVGDAVDANRDCPGQQRSPAPASANPWPSRFVAECAADGGEGCPAVVSAGGKWNFDGATPPGLCVYAAAGILQAVQAAPAGAKTFSARCAHADCPATFTVRFSP